MIINKMNLPKFTRLKPQGFTLIEIILVVSLIAVLASVSMTVINSEEKKRQSEDAVKTSNIQKLASGIESFKGAYGDYPASVSDVRIPIFIENWPEDQNGVPFNYTLISEDFTVYTNKSTDDTKYLSYSSSVGSITECTANPVTDPGSCSSVGSGAPVIPPPAAVSYNLVILNTGPSSISLSPAPDSSCGTFCYTYDEGSNVSLTLSNYTNYTWGGACAGTTSATCNLTMDANKNVGALYTAPTMYTLSYTIGGTGLGSVSAAPTGTSCGTGCYSYNSGTSVILTATPSAGSFFTGWSGGSCSGTNPVCTVNMSTNRTATASFSYIPSLYNLTWTVSGTGSGGVLVSPTGVSCGTNCRTYSEGTSVTLQTLVGEGSTFAGWSGACSGTNYSCTLSMNSNKAVGAVFNSSTPEPVNYTLSVTKTGATTSLVIGSNPPGISILASQTSGQASFPQGTVVNLYPSVQSGYTYTWGGACSGSTSCSVTMNANRVVSANVTSTAISPQCVRAADCTGQISCTGGRLPQCVSGVCTCPTIIGL